MPYPGRGDIPNRRASDANYDPVQMDMSEVQPQMHALDLFRLILGISMLRP